MTSSPSPAAELFEHRRMLNLQFLLGHLRDQRPDGALTITKHADAAEIGADGPDQTAGPAIELYDAERLARRLGHGDGFVGDPAEANNDEDAGQRARSGSGPGCMPTSAGPGASSLSQTTS